MTTIPWAFQQSGILMGIFVSFLGFITSYYTCSLIIKTAKKDSDYIFTLKKYFGKQGFYIGLIGPTILIFGAITVYFVVIVQSLYPLILVVLVKIFKINIAFIDPNVAPYSHFETFSATYVALIMYVVLVTVSLKKELTVFMRMGSIGAFCVLCLIAFTVGYGILSLTNTNFKFEFSSASDPKTKGALDYHPLYMYNSGFSNLAGSLCAGYFIHQCSIPIIANAQFPEKNNRNIFIGYVMVFLCYIVMGTLGYIGFTGSTFDELKDENGYIEIS